MSRNRQHLESLITPIKEFLLEHLFLVLHPKKIDIRKLSRGIDFVGYVLFQNHKLVRTCTKRRMKKKLNDTYQKYLKGKIEGVSMDQQLQSYLGILSHANQHKLSLAVKNAYWVRGENGKVPLF